MEDEIKFVCQVVRRNPDVSSHPARAKQ